MAFSLERKTDTLFDELVLHFCALGRLEGNPEGQETVRSDVLKKLRREKILLHRV